MKGSIMLRDLGTLGVRLVLGGAFAAHGAQKAFGWFGGPGAAGAAGFLESLGFKPGAPYARSAAYGEIGSGLAIVVGAGGPLAVAGVASIMTVAIVTVHLKNGFFAQAGGYELSVLYVLAAFALANDGYGRYSLDATLGDPFKERRLAIPALLAGAVSGLFIAGKRTLPPAQPNPELEADQTSSK